MTDTENPKPAPDSTIPQKEGFKTTFAKFMKDKLKEEKFDKDYVQVLQSETDKQSHLTIRLYQVLVFILKLVGKIILTINFAKFLDYCISMGIVLIPGLAPAVVPS